MRGGGAGRRCDREGAGTEEDAVFRAVPPLAQERDQRGAGQGGRLQPCRLAETGEDVLAGGAGEGVLGVLAREGLSPVVRVLGLPDRFVPHGSRDALLERLGLRSAGIARTIREMLGA